MCLVMPELHSCQCAYTTLLSYSYKQRHNDGRIDFPLSLYHAALTLPPYLPLPSLLLCRGVTANGDKRLQAVFCSFVSWRR